MGYAERVLQPGETIAYRARLHWVLMVRGFFLAGVALAGAIWAATMAASGARNGLLILSGLIAVAGAVLLAGAWLRTKTTEIIVTNRRIILKTGLISRNSIEMNLDKVESVLVNQSIPGRMLDYGTLVIRGVGAGLEPVSNVAAPLEFHRHVNAAG